MSSPHPSRPAARVLPRIVALPSLLALLLAACRGPAPDRASEAPPAPPVRTASAAPSGERPGAAPPERTEDGDGYGHATATSDADPGESAASGGHGHEHADRRAPTAGSHGDDGEEPEPAGHGRGGISAGGADGDPSAGPEVDAAGHGPTPGDAGAAHAGHGTGTQRDHRDRHGPPELESYVERLTSEKRIAELRPAAVARALELAPDAVVADLGCGPGVFVEALSRAVPEGVVYAVDVEPGQLDRVRARIAEHGLANVVPVLASYDDAHLPPERVDLVLLTDTYHHFEERAAYFGRLSRCLVPGGRLAIVEYLPGDLPVGPPADHKVAPEVRAAELGAAGFRLEREIDLHRWHEFEVWVHEAGEGGL